MERLSFAMAAPAYTLNGGVKRKELERLHANLLETARADEGADKPTDSGM